MKPLVMILGQEGYIGTALTAHLEEQGYDVVGADSNLREFNVGEVGSESLTPKKQLGAIFLDVCQDYDKLKHFFEMNEPDVIIHLAEQPSAPYSMRSAQDAVRTQRNNVLGTLQVLWAMKEAAPNAHLIKLGTEGEYPDWLWNGKHIPQGSRTIVLTPEGKGTLGLKESTPIGDLKAWEIPTPRYAGSWYHWSKVHDSMNIDYACRIWGLKATDVNQGVVYGHMNGTRLDYDEYFGTVVNRFAVQAVAGVPLTIYGTGEQTRGFIPLQNSIEALRLLIDNPPKDGEFRVIHQTTKAMSVNKIAELIQNETNCEIKQIENPRAEMPKNDFTFDTSTLDGLGLKPAKPEEVIHNLLKTVDKYKNAINESVIMPKTTWK